MPHLGRNHMHFCDRQARIDDNVDFGVKPVPIQRARAMSAFESKTDYGEPWRTSAHSPVPGLECRFIIDKK
jgi:hypothetical protein